MKNGRRGPTWNSNSRRINEIETVIRQRYGVLPATDDADVYLIPVALHLRERARGTASLAFAPVSHRHPDDDQRLDGATADELLKWCRTWAPKVAEASIRRAAAEACAKRSLPRAQPLAKRLRLTYADRQAWGITTIGSCDRTKKQRTADYMERKRERDRSRAASKRSALGKPSRDQWLANSLSRTKPWAALGISRAAYYRQRPKTAAE